VVMPARLSSAGPSSQLETSLPPTALTMHLRKTGASFELCGTRTRCKWKVEYT